MTLPASDTNPDVYRHKHANPRRRTREVLTSGRASEIAFIQRELEKRSKTRPADYIAMLIAGLVLVGAILTRSALLMICAMLITPLLKPLIAAALAPAFPSWAHLGQSLLALLLWAAIFFLTGWLAAFLMPADGADPGQLLSFLNKGDLTAWLVLIAASGLFAWGFVNEESRAHLASALLAFLILLPVACAGWQFQMKPADGWQALLLLALLRACVSMLVMLLTLGSVGLKPHKLSGWIMAVVLLLLSLGVGLSFISPLQLPGLSEQPAPEVQASMASMPTLLPATATRTPQASPTLQPSKTMTPAPSQTPAPSATHVPVIAVVTSETGLVLRAEPDINALILAYLNQGDQVTLLGTQQLAGGLVWEFVRISAGQEGWVTASYLQTPTSQE